MAARSSEKKKNNEDLTPEQINAQFNQLRQEQRAFLSKIGELEMDYSEHRYCTAHCSKYTFFRLFAHVLSI